MAASNKNRYYILPKNDPLRAVNILRAAAGLAPWPGIAGEPQESTNDQPSLPCTKE